MIHFPNLHVILITGFISYFTFSCSPSDQRAASSNKITDLSKIEQEYFLAQNAVNIFIVAGQSNAVGNGRQWSAELDASSNPRVMQWNRFSKKIVPAQERLHHQSPDSIKRTGFGSLFGKTYSKNNGNARVLLVPTAKGGSGFSNYGPNPSYWEVNGPSGNPGTGPSTTIAAVREAINASRLANPGIEHVIRAILWHQGENDTNANSTQEDYQNALARLVNHLRTNLNYPGSKISLIVGGLSPEWIADKPKNVLTALEGVASYINGATFVSANELKGNPGDIIHFDSASQRIMALRYADAITKVNWNSATVRDFQGTDSADEINGNDLPNRISGFGGDDKLRGLGGDDFINGNVGNDFINGNAGNDTVRGGAGNDEVHGGSGDDIIHGDKGDDNLFGEKGNDTYVYKTGDGNDTITDSEGADTLNCPDHANVAVSESREGNDHMIGLPDGSIRIVNHYTGMAIETINCGKKAAPISLPKDFPAGPTGLYSSDINGTENGEILEGNNANNKLSGLGGNDTIRGLGGDDQVNGNAGNDIVSGNIGNDFVRGGSEDDTVRGGSGNDIVHGDIGNDTLYGDLGNDKLFGGAGNDLYVYSTNGGIDIISDSSGQDSLSCPDHQGVIIPRVRDGNDLLLIIGNGGIRILNHFNSNQIEQINCGM